MGLALILAAFILSIPFLIGVVIATNIIARSKSKKRSLLVVVALTSLIAVPSYLVPHAMAGGNFLKQIEAHSMLSIVIALASITFLLAEKAAAEQPEYLIGASGLLSLISNPLVYSPVGGIFLYPFFVVPLALKSLTMTSLFVAAFFLGCFIAIKHIEESLGKLDALKRIALLTTIIALLAHFLPIMLDTLERKSAILVLHDQAAIVLIAAGLVSIVFGKLARRTSAYLYASSTLLAIVVHPNVHPVLARLV